ncbi:MAG TPA: MFS transporter [Baekduia sp.]|uniref:MFS transporter n=1 Tax=Baekduia sp. TaxID=2600305 RepID=UPI002D79613B|nr:MFS transporter [Baekduia sp.]HET6509108.1 MFS transporter [Baekduia sp.]
MIVEERPEGPVTAPRRLLVAIAAVLALDATFYSAVTPLLPTLERQFGLTASAAGLLVATYALGLLAAALPAGWLAARIGCRPAMVLSLILFAIASAAFGLGTSATVLDATRGLQGVAAAVTWAAGFAWLVAVGPRERQGALLGAAMSAAVAGSLCGPMLGALAASGGRGPVFCAIAVGAVALAVVMRRLPAPPRSGDLRLGPTVRALAAGAGATGGWVVLLAGLMVGGMAVAAPLTLDGLGAGPAGIGMVFVLAAIGEVAIGPAVGRLVDARGAGPPIRLTLILMASLLVLLSLAATLTLTVALLIVVLPLAIALLTPGYALIGGVAELRGIAPAGLFGAGNLAWAGGEGLGALAAGWLASGGRPDLMYLAVGALALLTAVALRTKV